MLIGSVVQDQFDDDTDAALVGGLKKSFEIVQIAVTGVDGPVFRDVIAVVAQGRGKERHQPDGVDAQFLQVIELLRQTPEIADAVCIGVEKCAHVDLVDDRVFVPERVLRHGQGDSLLRFNAS